MQLVAMGAQDVFLTGNPQITFFKVVYRRHTNFSKECIKQEFNGSVPKTGGTSGSVTCTLARNGDLVQEIYLQATVNANDDTATHFTHAVSIIAASTVQLPSGTMAPDNGKLVSFTANISTTDTTDATSPVNKVAITGGRIYEVTGKSGNGFGLKYNGVGVTWPDISGPNVAMIAHSSKLVLESSAANKDLTHLVNTVEVEIGGQKIDKHYSKWFDIYNELFETNHDYRNIMTDGTPGNDKIVYIPLRFWFNRNAGLALPLIALQYHEVKILVNLKVPSESTLKDANLLVNYVYLDTDERRRFAQVSHEYLIEQVQHTGVETMPAGGTDKVNMNFNHPVKGLFWITDGANYLDKVKIQLNGHDRFSEERANYFHLVQPYECGLGNGHSVDITTRVWGPLTMCNEKNSVGMYSFCLNPGEHQPSGSCNFSRIDNARLNYTCGTNTEDKLHLFALNYNVLRIMSGMGGLTYSN